MFIFGFVILLFFFFLFFNSRSSAHLVHQHAHPLGQAGTEEVGAGGEPG